MFDPERDRITELERRVLRLERLVNAAGSEAVATPTPGAPQSRAGTALPSSWVTPGNATAPANVTAPAVPAARPGPPPPPARPRSFADLEEQLSGRLLAWVGGAALVLGAMFFLSLAFSRGWIGPEARVVIGIIGGVAAFAAGTWLFGRRQETPATVLIGVGVGTVSLALFAASRLYELIPVETALLGAFIVAVVTGLVALRANSQAVAGFGLVAITLAPPVLGASPTLVTVAYLAAAVVGTAAVAVRRPWSRLALVAFLATAPQATWWLADESSAELVFVAILAFWAVHAIGATGRAILGRTRTLDNPSTLHATLNVLWAVLAFHNFVEDPFTRSVGILVVAVAQGLIAFDLIDRRSVRHPVGSLNAGLALATLSLGIALELGGIARPLAWTGLALATAWLATVNRDRLTAVSAGLIASLAVADLTLVQYPLQSFEQLAPEGLPFGSPAGIVVVAMAGAAVIAGWFTSRSLVSRPAPDARWSPDAALVAGVLGGIALLAYAAPFEVFADLVVVAWSVLAIGSLGLFIMVGRDARAATGAIAGALALLGGASLVAVGLVAPIDRLAVDPVAVRGWWAGATVGPLAIAPLVAVSALAGLVMAREPIRGRGTSKATLQQAAGPVLVTAAALALYLVSVLVVAGFQARANESADPFETATQAQVALSIVWVLVGAASFAIGLVRGITLARLFGLGVLSLAVAKVFLFDLAALDVAYRVLSLIGLGGALLASSFVANRFRPIRTPARGDGSPAVAPTAAAAAAPTPGPDVA